MQMMQLEKIGQLFQVRPVYFWTNHKKIIMVYSSSVKSLNIFSPGVLRAISCERRGS